MEQKIKLIAVNMGYGHQRTAYPLRGLAGDEEIIQANDYEGIPEKDRKIWTYARRFYEFVSTFKRIPFFGWLFFSLLDQLQKIFSFYPRKELINANFQVKQIFSLIKKGWGRDLISRIDSNVPLISTFFTPVFMAEFFNYSGKIFCVVCDTDVARTWVSQNPAKSRIKYFASTERVFERLKTYGVKKENIFFTGYPLPMENVGEKGEIAKEDLKLRLLNLDPKKKYSYYYEPLIKKYLGELPKLANRPLTIMFSVGGAGAQKEIGIKIARSLAKFIGAGEIKLILSVGTKEKAKRYFEKNIQNLGLKNVKNVDLVRNSPPIGPLSVRARTPLETSFLSGAGEISNGVEIIFDKKIGNYFQKFNQALRSTDVLWTKPSELSFYSALGLPIIIAPPIGSQEESNMRWLVKSGFGIMQENPDYCHQWLFDWLKRGYLAEAAMQGFIEGEKFGTLKIKNIIVKKQF